MQHLKVGYSDILAMPTSERRYYLGMLVRHKEEEAKRIEEQSKTTNTGKGTRKSTISGEALKNKMKTGEIPLQ